MKKDITELFVFIDDFCKAANIHMEKYLISQSNRTPTREPQMAISEILTIVLLYHKSPCKNFKSFYLCYLPLYHTEFPALVSYERFVQLKQRILPYLALLLDWFRSTSEPTGIYFVDATSIGVCHNKRISRNKVFKGVAARGKSTMGWFYGFKLHLVINEHGEIQGVALTAGNVDDRTPVPNLVKHLKGLLFGDKGYIKMELFKTLYERGLKLITGIKKGMKNILMPLYEKRMLRKRSIIETVFDYLKNKFELVHTRHRSVGNFLVHVLSTIASYSMKSVKPSVRREFCLGG
jgi:Transposase DDE domain